MGTNDQKRSLPHGLRLVALAGAAALTLTAVSRPRSTRLPSRPGRPTTARRC